MRENKIYPYKGEQPFVFISYSHRNMDEAVSIIKLLQKDNYRVWYDEGIDPGSEWDENIASHVEKCGYFIALLSEEYLQSSNCKDELNYARELEKPRLLVYLKDVQLPGGMRMRLSRLQAIHKYKYETEYLFITKLEESEGLELCKEVVDYPMEFVNRHIFQEDSHKICINGRFYDAIKIGQGYAGKVYKIYDEKKKRYYVVKTYSVTDAFHIPMFYRTDLRCEIEEMSHPGITSIINIMRGDDPQVISEYVDGVTLDQYIKQEKVSISHALVIVWCILDALTYIHSKGIYYGDVTPYNIMIEKNGGVKLCDFSESNYNNSKFDDITILVHKFRSPEKRPGEMVDFKSDIYEVGMILDELTVKDICETSADEWFGGQIVISEKKNDSEINNLIRKIIQKAIQSDPDERYSSAEEMRNELEVVLDRLEGKMDVYQYLAAHK